MQLRAGHAAAAEEGGHGLDPRPQHQRPGQHQLREALAADAQTGQVGQLGAQLALWEEMEWKRKISAQ